MKQTFQEKDIEPVFAEFSSKGTNQNIF